MNAGRGQEGGHLSYSLEIDSLTEHNFFLRGDGKASLPSQHAPRIYLSAPLKQVLVTPELTQDPKLRFACLCGKLSLTHHAMSPAPLGYRLG